MSEPRNEVVQMEYQNPHASMPLYLPVLVIANTPDEVLQRNIRENAKRALRWVACVPEHHGIAVLVGGGPSVADSLTDIRGLVDKGAHVFAMNAASRWLRGKGIAVDFQVIADAKTETASLVDSGAREHLFASQVDPATIDTATRQPRLWHLAIDFMEDLFPPDRVKRGGYVLLGGGATVGNSALCLAYAMGYREIHIFGFDSCHAGKHSHVYPQEMNRFIPVTDVEWGGRWFRSSLAMKAQAEKFQVTAQELQRLGCGIHVHGDGLLQTMWRTPPADLNERDKYRRLWQFEGYRAVSPGELVVPTALAVMGLTTPPGFTRLDVEPRTVIIDFGCGTGRAALALKEHGFDVMLVDFADNCRDDEALSLPFLEWDLTKPIPLAARFGLCADVMEHIPPGDVDTVIRNIMDAASNVFFQISTVPDNFGEVVHDKLHNTVQPHDWWYATFKRLGFDIYWSNQSDIASKFYVRNLSDRT